MTQEETPGREGAGDPASSLGHVPDGPWKFDREVTSCFADMLWRSIPSYDRMRYLVEMVGGHFLPAPGPGLDVIGPTVVDLGASTGLGVAPFVNRARRVVCCEVSEPMREAMERRFKDKPKVEVLDIDLRHGYAPVNPNTVSLTLSILTLQFIPIEYRGYIVQAAYDSLKPGGGLILVEKVLGDTAKTQTLLTKEYWAHKELHGYTPEEIRRKAMSLEGQLVSLSAAGNERMLDVAGFRHIECFWRDLNFVGWVAIK